MGLLETFVPKAPTAKPEYPRPHRVQVGKRRFLRERPRKPTVNRATPGFTAQMTATLPTWLPKYLYPSHFPFLEEKSFSFFVISPCSHNFIDDYSSSYLPEFPKFEISIPVIRKKISIIILNMSQMCSLVHILVKRFLDDVILDLFSGKHTGKKSEKKF